MPALADLAGRMQEARRHLGECLLCEHRCRANRLAGERGPCKAGPAAHLFRHRIEYSEELERPRPRPYPAACRRENGVVSYRREATGFIFVVPALLLRGGGKRAARRMPRGLDQSRK